jgi:hypothetical protein
MSDLTTAVDLLMERLPEGTLPALEGAKCNDKNYIQRLKGKRLLTVFGHLNREELFGWSDEVTIDFVEINDVPWDNPNLFVPAQWSLDVIATVKNHGKPMRPTARQLFEVNSGCLSEREKIVLELRLGLGQEPPLGVPWSLEQIAKKFVVTRERIRQIEAKALRKLDRATQAVKVQDYVRPHLLDAIHIDNMLLSVRTHNALSNAGLDTAGKLRRKTLEEMRSLKNLGTKGLREVSDRLIAQGINPGWF